MAWVRIDDSIAEHPKMAQVGGLGLALQVAGLAYSNRNLTDGYIPRNAAHNLIGWEIIDQEGRTYTAAISCGRAEDDLKTTWLIDRLVEVGIWHDQTTVSDCDECADLWPENRDYGYLIHGYSDYQPTSAQIQAKVDNKVKQRVEAGRQRATSAGRDAGGKFTSEKQVKPQVAPSPTSERPASDQRLTSDLSSPNPNPKPLVTTGEGLENSYKSEVLTLARPQKPSSAIVSTSDPSFEAFWVVYPRKVGKRQAEAAYKRATARAAADEIMRGAVRYLHDPNRDPSYTAHPTTWLNRDGWLDDPLPARGGESTTTALLNEAMRLAEAGL